MRRQLTLDRARNSTTITHWMRQIFLLLWHCAVYTKTEKHTQRERENRRHVHIWIFVLLKYKKYELKMLCYALETFVMRNSDQIWKHNFNIINIICIIEEGALNYLRSHIERTKIAWKREEWRNFGESIKFCWQWRSPLTHQLNACNCNVGMVVMASGNTKSVHIFG